MLVPPMVYRTVFEVGFQWWIPFLAVTLGSLVVLVGWAFRASRGKDAFIAGLVFQIVGAAGVLWGFVFGVLMYGEYRGARKALATHDYSVVEGTVSNFVRMSPGGHSTESFVVNGVRFEYGSGSGSTTFNSEWNKGFICNGVEARITYIGKGIIKVEVK